MMLDSRTKEKQTLRKPLSTISPFSSKAWHPGMTTPEGVARLSFMDCLADALTFPGDLGLKKPVAGVEGLRADRENIRGDFQKATARVLKTYKGKQDISGRLRAVQIDHEHRLDALTALCMRLISERQEETASR